MGNSSPQPTIYSVPITEPKSGESSIYRNPKSKNSLISTPDNSILTLKDYLDRSEKLFGNMNCLGTKNSEGVYIWKTYKESIDLGRFFGAGLNSGNFAPKAIHHEGMDLKFLAIYSKNREEFIITDLACILYGFTSIPIYDTLGVEAVDFIFEHTQVEILVCSLENIKKLIKEKRVSKLRTIITFEDPNLLDPIEKSFLQEANINTASFWTIIENSKKSTENKNSNFVVTPKTVFTFCYTSGTTGKPKGAMLTHSNFVSAIANVVNIISFSPQDVYLSYLPLAHVLERLAIHSMLYHGVQVGFYSGDVQKLKDDLQSLKPTFFVTVPRLLLRFHDVIKTNLEKLKGCKRSISSNGVKSKLANLSKSGKLTHGTYDGLVFKKMKAALGGRVKNMIVGSAPTSPEVLDFMKIAFSCPIMEGYGQTESTGASFVTYREDGRSSGCVGGPCVNTEFKLVDVPEMSYTSKDLDENNKPSPRGELCMRGFGVFQGYFKDDEKTKEAIDEDGWLHTGDIVKLLQNGAIKIIDRKKNIFKLSHGEYVAAEKIESVYLKCHCIAEIFVYGDSFQSYLVGIVVPNLDAIKEMAKKLNIVEDNIDILLQKKEIKNAVLNELNSQGKTSKLFGFEMVKNIHFEKESFAIKDILTTTFKIKRHEAKNVFQKVIEELYKEPIGNN